MSTLEKTINLLNELPEKQIEIIYSYVKFVSLQQIETERLDEEDISGTLENIIGVLSDTGKSLEDYREERMAERYEL